ncbi:MAG: sulfurtransferase [Granulosicoccaceae bacterium]
MYRIILFLASMMVVRLGLAAPVYVEPDWLAERLNDAKVVVVDMTDDPQYLRYHIPGAIRLGYGDLVMSRKKDKVSIRIPDNQLVKLLGIVGIARDSHVVIYDDMAGLNAGRLFWELERIGHPNVSVLRGGLVQWLLAGHNVDNNETRRRPVSYESNGQGRANEAGLEDIVTASREQSVSLLDVRSPEEYLGHPRAKRSGHIPGARLWSWQESVDFERGFVPKPAPALLTSLAAAGAGDKAAPVYLYCRSGHRAAQSYLTLRGLGYEKVRLYDGSMAEYARQPGLPLVTGRAAR